MTTINDAKAITQQATDNKAFTPVTGPTGPTGATGAPGLSLPVFSTTSAVSWTGASFALTSTGSTQLKGSSLNFGDGTVNQPGSINGTVTLNASSGTIATFSGGALMPAGDTESFQVNNSHVNSTSIVLVCCNYPEIICNLIQIAFGSFIVQLCNVSASQVIIPSVNVYFFVC